MKVRNLLIVATSGLIFGGIGYLTTRIILGKNFDIELTVIGVVWGVFIAWLIIEYFCLKEARSKRAIETQYQESRLDNNVVLEKFLPELFSGKERVNVIITSSYASYRTRHLILSGLPNSVEPKKIQEETEKIFLNIETYVDLSLPNYVFIQIGKYCFGNDVHKVLRDLKIKYPKTEIYVMCSGFYWDTKCKGIEELIKEGTVNEQKLADSVAHVFFAEKMIAVISKSLAKK